MTERAPDSPLAQHPDGPPRSDAAAGPRTRSAFGGAAWQLGHVRGIEIALDQSWLLIFALITFSLRSQFAVNHESWTTGQAWLAALITSLVFFASIVLHELGHSLTAQQLGLRVRSITLYLFGGMAQLDSEPRRPRDEVMIAIAGPAVSLALAIGFDAMAAALRGGTGAMEMAAAMCSWLGRINLVLAVFNCLPGFPLDGGRVLRGAVWAATGSFERATSIAAAAGSTVAYFLIGLGIFSALFAGQIVGGLWLAFIGWFLLSAARATVDQVVVERILSGIPSRVAMAPVRDTAVSGSESIAQLVNDSVLRRGVRTFYVVDGAGALQGLATLQELAAVPEDERPTTRVDTVMVPAEQLVILHPDESCWKALREMVERGVNQLPVVEGRQLVGAVTRERLLGLVQAGMAFERGRR